MGGIIRKDIRCLPGDFTQDVQKNTYCPFCEEHGFYERLGPRILKPNEPVPTDYENWKQCTACGRISPTYTLKYESKLEDFIETSDNPFDQGKIITGLNNKLGKSRYQRERQKLLDRIEQEKDTDIKRELRKGNTVQIIED